MNMMEVKLMVKKEKNYQNNRKIGAYEENIATKYLSDNGYKIIEKNFFTKIGEIDIIANDEDDVLCFIEVKYRKSKNFGEGLEAVDKKKQRRIYNSARIYMCLNHIKEDRKCRFDVVSILDDEITLIKNAFFK